MYNAEIKQTYINEITASSIPPVRADLIRLFSTTEPFEEQYNKDISSFTKAEISGYYKSRFSDSVDSLLITNEKLSRYTRYMLTKNLVPDNQNHFEEMTPAALNLCINTVKAMEKVITREKLLQEIEGLYNPGDKFLVLGLFEGLCGKSYMDFVGLTLDDFDGNMVRLSSGRKLRVSDRLVALAEEAAGEYYYYMYGTINDQAPRIFDQTDNSIIKRQCNTREDNDKTCFRRIYSQIRRIAKYLESPAYDSKALIESGRIDMIKNFMREDATRVPEETIRKHRQDIEYRYGKLASNSISRYIVRFGEYLTADNG